MAGLATIAITGTGDPRFSVGANATLNSVAAIVLGGIALTGGVGSVIGVVATGVILIMLNPILVAMGINANTAQVIQGALIAGGMMIGGLLTLCVDDRRLPARFTLPVTGFILSGIMTIMISGISTLLALGPGPEFLARWPIAWLSSWVIAFPNVLVVLPIVRRIVARIVAAP
jgi:hypothetical protein